MALHTTLAAQRDPQPWHDETHGQVITADARIDNRAELSHLLGFSETAGQGPPDSQLILASWRRWGESCVAHLLGDFAFALWDIRARRLFCARDPFGLRPFYYAHTGSQLVFASSARAVVRAQGVRVDLDRGRVADYLEGLEGINETCSLFADVKRLPPAHAAVFERGSLTLHKYWRPDSQQELRLGSDGEYQEAFASVFSQAVADRLVSQAPVASMLSGGLDSSTIVAVAREQASSAGCGPFSIFSAISAEPAGCLESGFIHQVVVHGGLKPHFVSPADTGPGGGALERVLSMVEEPWETIHLIAALMYLNAGYAGHRVVLDGVDGDLVTALSPSYPVALASRGRLVKAWMESRAQQRNCYRAEPQAGQFLGLLCRALALLLGRGGGTTPTIFRAMLNLRHQRTRQDSGADLLVTDSLAREVCLADRIREFHQTSIGERHNNLQQASIARLTVPYLTAAVERYERLAAVCGVEARKPFLDRRLVEFCISLPWDQKNRDGWSKYILRGLAESILPHEVAWRRGREHLAPVFAAARLERHRAEWLATLGAQRERLVEWVDAGRFDRVVKSVADGSGDEITQVWKLLSLSGWLERNGH